MLIIKHLVNMTDMTLIPKLNSIYIVCGLLLFALGLTPDLNAGELDATELQVPEETLLALVAVDMPPAPRAQKPPSQSPLTQLIRRVVSDNQQIQIQKTAWMIRQAEAEETRAIFEPELITSLERQVNSQHNSIVESLGLNSASTYDEDNWNYDASIQALAPTGGKMKLGYNFSRLSNSLTKSLTSEDNEYQMYLGVSLSQPLLKNAGATATKAGIMAADLESSAAFQEYRLKMMQRVSNVSVDYWDYYQAQKKLELRQDSFRISEKILADNQERHRTGKMAETEVLEAKIGVNTRQSLLSETAHEQLQVANRLRSLMAQTRSTTTSEMTPEEIKPGTAEASTLELELSDPKPYRLEELNRDEIIQTAFTLRPEYLAAKKRLEQAEIKIGFAKNQRWPELDLIASYGLNGLDFDTSGSLEQLERSDHAAWAVGLELHLPLQGGIESRSKLKKSKLEKRRQIITLKDIEIELKNRIDTAIDNVHKSTEQLHYAEQIIAIQKRLFEVEMMRLQAGQSSSRLVLEKEDNYRSARENALTNIVKQQRALIEMDLTSGAILQKYGVDIMEAAL